MNLRFPYALLIRLFGVFLCVTSVAMAQPQPTYDAVIRNGKIIDGTGNPWYRGDIAIQGERIVAIGNLQNANAKRVIDAAGMVVAPGFIDMLGQSELSLLIDSRSLSKDRKSVV